MFKRKQYWFYYFNLPIIILFVLAVIAFIVATFYDEIIASFFAQFYYNLHMRYWLKLYDTLGVSLLTIALPIAIAIIIESILLSYQTKLSWLNRNQWLIWLGYSIFIILLCYFNITDIIHTKTNDEGYGPGIDAHFVLTWQSVIKIKIPVFIIVLIIDSTFIGFLRLKFIKNSNFMAQKYWADSIQVLSVLLLYILIWLMKRGFGRPFYLTVNFKDNNIAKMLIDIGGVRDNHINDFTGYYYGENGGIFYHPWYQPNNFKENFTWKYLWMWSPVMNEYMRGLGDGWNNGAFPSGHMVATYTFLSLIFYFIGKNRKVTRGKIVLIIIFAIFLLSMNFNLIIAQTHWLTDTCFSIICCTLFIWLASYVINKKIKKL